MKTIIIGGVAGGATVAARLRRMDEQAEIVLIERGEYISYANCGLPYYIGNTITERANLLVQTVEGFKDRFAIDIRNMSEVTSIYPEEKRIEIKDLTNDRIYSESYDKLVVSTGAEPIKPQMQGIDSDLIFTLRNIPDMDRIKNYMNSNKPKSAIVVGGGFIGLEMVENLKDAGIEVYLIERSNQVMTPIDYTMATMVHEHLKNKGINLLLEENVTKFITKEGQIEAKLASGNTIAADMVILSIGVKPESTLAKEAKLDINAAGAIIVNEYMQTSDRDIYALGDVTEILNPVIGKRMTIPLAGPANKQGRIVASNIVDGNKHIYKGTIGTSIAKIFDLTVAATGVSTKILNRENIEYQVSITHSNAHASYYPGSLPLSIQLVFDPINGKIYGAQIIGFDGVDKRIDLISQTIKNNGTIYDLQEIEHAYAPPYSSAKDPVNMAGFVAENILSKKVNVIQWNEIEVLRKQPDTIIIDTRTEDEYRMGHIEDAISIPLDELRNRISEIPSNKTLLLYCAVGLRGYIASRILSQSGYKNVFNLSGGYKTFSIASQTDIAIPSASNPKKSDTLSNTFLSDKMIEIDACGLQCPGPIMQLKKHYDQLNQGECLQIKVTDQAFGADLQGWANMVGANILSISNSKGIITANIEKGTEKDSPVCEKNQNEGKTLVVFSDDLDRALASFVIANGAAASGKKVSMFFTFWGLNVIKKKIKPKTNKDFMGKMFGFMLPSNSKKLGLSQMNLGGMGSKMMRYIMKSKGIDSLETLMQQSIENGVEIIACSMSMDVMGIKAEELMDGITIGGVAAYLDRTDRANTNLFI